MKQAPIIPEEVIQVPTMYMEEMIKKRFIEHYIDDVYIYVSGNLTGQYITFTNGIKTK